MKKYHEEKTIYVVSECPYAGMLKAMSENAKIMNLVGINVTFVFPSNIRDRYGELLRNNMRSIDGIGNVMFVPMTKKYCMIMMDSIRLYRALRMVSGGKIIIFSYGSYAGKLARILYFFKKIAILYHFPQCVEFERMSIRYKLSEFIIERMLAPFSSKYMACSPSEAYRLHAYCGISSDKILFNPNSILAEVAHDYAKKYSFIYVGRIVKSKGICDILDALKYLGMLHELIVLGDGDELKSMREAYPEANFLGNVESSEVSKYLNASRYIINNSRVEGMSFSLIEAMSLGVIPIVSRVDGNDDVIINAYNGFVFKDKKELIKTLFKASLVDGAKVKLMSSAALHTASKLRYINKQKFSSSIKSLINDLYDGRKEKKENSFRRLLLGEERQ